MVLSIHSANHQFGFSIRRALTPYTQSVNKILRSIIASAILYYPEKDQVWQLKLPKLFNSHKFCFEQV